MRHRARLSHDVVVDPGLAEALRRRFASRLVNAWPQGELSEAELLDRVFVGEGIVDDAPALVVTFAGSTLSLEWHGSPGDAEASIDEAADLIADDLESDRWISGDGWREYGR